jgi:hypothetical protein
MASRFECAAALVNIKKKNSNIQGTLLGICVVWLWYLGLLWKHLTCVKHCVQLEILCHDDTNDTSGRELDAMGKFPAYR